MSNGGHTRLTSALICSASLSPWFSVHVLYPWHISDKSFPDAFRLNTLTLQTCSNNPVSVKKQTKKTLTLILKPTTNTSVISFPSRTGLDAVRHAAVWIINSTVESKSGDGGEGQQTVTSALNCPELFGLNLTPNSNHRLRIPLPICHFTEIVRY